MHESVCYVLIFYGAFLSGGVSGWYIYVHYVDVFRLVKMDLCYLQFSFLYVDVGWYIFRCVCYVVL